MDYEILNATAAFDFLMNWGNAFWHSLLDTAPYLLFGLISAGILHVMVPSRIILWGLGQGGFLGSIKGALLGLPLPLCSCSVLPTAFALRRQGASLSSTVAFTISTPETSIDALAMTFALLPMAFFGVRPLASLVLAIVVGYGVDLFCRSSKDELRRNILYFNQLKEDEPKNPKASPNAKKQLENVSDEFCRVCGLTSSKGHEHGWVTKISAVFKYAFGTFFNDIAWWLLIGLIAAAFIEQAIPAGFFKEGLIAKSPQLQVILAILIGIPVYTCATATTPMVAALLAKGLSPGAALAFLLSGPATNIGSFFVIKKELGKRVTFVYYFILFATCVLMGFAFNFTDGFFATQSWYQSLTQLPIGSETHEHQNGVFQKIQTGSAWLILGLCFKLVWTRYRFKGHGHSHSHDEHDGHDHSHD